MKPTDTLSLYLEPCPVDYCEISAIEENDTIRTIDVHHGDELDDAAQSKQGKDGTLAESDDAMFANPSTKRLVTDDLVNTSNNLLSRKLDPAGSENLNSRNADGVEANHDEARRVENDDTPICCVTTRDPKTRLFDCLYKSETVSTASKRNRPRFSGTTPPKPLFRPRVPASYPLGKRSELVIKNARRSPLQINPSLQVTPKRLFDRLYHSQTAATTGKRNEARFPYQSPIKSLKPSTPISSHPHVSSVIKKNGVDASSNYVSKVINKATSASLVPFFERLYRSETTATSFKKNQARFPYKSPMKTSLQATKTLSYSIQCKKDPQKKNQYKFATCEAKRSDTRSVFDRLKEETQSSVQKRSSTHFPYKSQIRSQSNKFLGQTTSPKPDKHHPPQCTQERRRDDKVFDRLT